jgi:propanol-preferring alcohol dehydrogenase
MRAAVVTEFGAPLQVSELELPTPGYGEALVKLETSGVCHTDLHAAHGDWPVKPQPPFIPGPRVTAPSSHSVGCGRPQDR